MNRQKRKALIIGCGVAGPVAALLLQRAGIEAEIYEARAESTDYGGSFLNMACNGLGVLKTLGLDDQVSSQGSHRATSRYAARRSGAGRPRSAWQDLSGHSRRLSGARNRPIITDAAAARPSGAA